MKATVANYIKKLGGTAHYSGRTRTMYIRATIANIPTDDIETATLQHFGYGLPFKIAS